MTCALPDRYLMLPTPHGREGQLFRILLRRGAIRQVPYGNIFFMTLFLNVSYVFKKLKKKKTSVF